MERGVHVLMRRLQETLVKYRLEGVTSVKTPIERVIPIFRGL